MKKITQKRLPKVSKINTKYLIQISNSYRAGDRIEGTTETGADYAHIIDEIESELFHRQAMASERALLSHERQLSQSEAEQRQARQCTKCSTFYPLNQVEAFFSKVAGKANHYRPACKACHAKEAKERRALNKIEVPF